MKRYFRLALSALAMLLVMLLSAAITLRLALHGHEVHVPDFAGMTVAEASTAALKTGVDLNIENKFYSTTIPAGRVLSQAPAAGSTVRGGWQVRVIESLGPQQVTIPDVVGQPLRQASINIRRMSLDLGTLAHMDAPGDPDMTLAQTPPPNAGVDQPRVNLLLSSSAGGASNAIVLPSFVGWSFPAANHAAIALGLRVAAIGDVPPPTPTGATGSTSATTPAGASAPGTTPGPNGTRLDANGQPVAQSMTQSGTQAIAQPETPAQPTGPVTSQSPQAGFRATRGDVIRLTLGHPSDQAPTPPAPPAQP
jgi:beta-lactam-binding protein with PASTA domain